MPEMPEAVSKALEGVEGAEGLSQSVIDAIAAALAALPAATPEVVEEPVADVTPEVVEVAEVGKSAESNVALEKALDEVAILKAEINKEREAREVRDMLDVVRKDYSAFSDKAGDLGLALYRLEKNATTEADRKVLKDSLAEASRIYAESTLMKEVGVATHATSDVGGELEKIARGFMERDGINHAQAISKALETAEGKAAYEAERKVR